MGKSQFEYGKGRKSLTNAPGGGAYAEKWYQKLDYMQEPKKNQPKEIRLVGGVFTIFQHFVRFKRKDGSKGGFYVVCPNWDWENGVFRKGPDATCPLCMDFQSDDLPQELRMLGSFRYYSDAFDITSAKNGNTDVYGVIHTNKYGKNDLITISEIAGADIDDLEKGCTVHWNYDENAKDPKDRVRFYQGKPMPVDWDGDKGLFVLKKKFIGKSTDFAEIIDVQDSEEIRSDLKRLGLYTMLEEALETLGRHVASPVRTPRSTTRPAALAAKDDSWDEDEDDVDEAPAPRKGNKVKPKPPVEDADADWDADDEDEAPAPKRKPAAAVKPTKPTKPPVDDDLSDADEDDAPAPPKKAGKKGATVSKKEPAPEEDDWADEDAASADWDDAPVASDDNWDEEPETSKKKPAAKKPGKKPAAPVVEADDDDEDSW